MNFTPYSYTRPQIVGAGIEIVVSKHALRDTDKRLFPVSKHRSKRIHKKLIKRFGGEFIKEPCIWRRGDKIVMHPECYTAFQKEMARRNDEIFMAAMFPKEASHEG